VGASFGRFFTVLAHIERGVCGYQDAVVLRK
jgi:hypothetical protein